MKVSRVTKVMSHIIGVRKKSDPKKGSTKQQIHKKGVRETKSLETSGVVYNLATKYRSDFRPY